MLIGAVVLTILVILTIISHLMISFDHKVAAGAAQSNISLLFCSCQVSMFPKSESFNEPLSFTLEVSFTLYLSILMSAYRQKKYQ